MSKTCAMALAFVYRSLRTSCDAVNNEVACYDTINITDRLLSLLPGTYFLFVERSELSHPDPFTTKITIQALVIE